MGYAYLFALIVGLGILSIQAVLGSKDGGDGDMDGDADADMDADGDADADADADGDADGDAHTEQELAWSGADFVTLFLSVRFWVFACLGFGLSGTLLHFVTSVGAIPTAITACILGLSSGLSAALMFRLLKRTASSVAEHTDSATGSIGRVIVPVSEASVGKIRIQLAGQSVDLMARTTGLRIERGDAVVIEEIEGDIAYVSRAPDELQR
jgi:membrane protein implicated in regulation of membrane protease activity